MNVNGQTIVFADGVSVRAILRSVLYANRAAVFVGGHCPECGVDYVDVEEADAADHFLTHRYVETEHVVGEHGLIAAPGHTRCRFGQIVTGQTPKQRRM